MITNDRRLIALIALFSFFMMPAIGVEYVNTASSGKVLCEDFSAKNATEIILAGQNIQLISPDLNDFWVGPKMSILIDFLKHKLSVANINTDHGNTREEAITVSPEGNESTFKISGKNLMIVEPCPINAPIGGIELHINFTSRSFSISSAW